MKKYKWTLSGLAILMIITCACDPVLEDETTIATVNSMPDNMLFSVDAEGKNIPGFDYTFDYVSDASWCFVSDDKIMVESNTTRQPRMASVNVNWNYETMKVITVTQIGLYAPTNVRATQSGSSIVISWSSVSGATSYDVYYWSSANSTYYFLGSTTSTTITDTHPYSGANYYLVRAVSSSSTSEYGNANCDYKAVPTGSFTFYTAVNDGIITVTLNGYGSKQITTRYSYNPGCNASGCATFSNIPYGTYTFTATSNSYTWKNTITISSSCSMQHLIL